MGLCVIETAAVESCDIGVLQFKRAHVACISHTVTLIKTQRCAPNETQ